MIVRNRVDRGQVADVTHALYRAGVNVANMSLKRDVKGGSALMVIEMDEPIQDAVLKYLDELPGILNVTYYEKEA